MLTRPPVLPSATAIGKVSISRAELRRLQRREQRNAWQKTYRERARDGVAVAPTPYTVDVISFLIRTKWLDPKHEHDRREIGAAIGRMLADAAKG